MRGIQDFQGAMFSYFCLEERMPAALQLRKLRAVVDALLAKMNDEFEAVYARRGPPSTHPEMLLKALLLHILFSVRNKRKDEDIGTQRGHDPNAASKGQERCNDTLPSITNAVAWLFKGQGNKSRLCHMGHIVKENCTRLIVDVEITHASGSAEREATLAMLQRRGNEKIVPRSVPTRATTSRSSSRAAANSKSRSMWRPRTGTRR